MHGSVNQKIEAMANPGQSTKNINVILAALDEIDEIMQRQLLEPPDIDSSEQSDPLSILMNFEERMDAATDGERITHLGRLLRIKEALMATLNYGVDTLLDILSEPPRPLVKVVETITAELIQYLNTHPQALYRLEPRKFEELIAEILASYGWQVHLTPASKDGGYDIFAISKDVAGVTTSWIIECKKYHKDRKIGVDIVRALYGANQLLDYQGDYLMLATTSYFTKGVHDIKASRYDLELRDYEGILEWINEYRPNPNGRLYIKDNQLMLPGKK